MDGHIFDDDDEAVPLGLGRPPVIATRVHGNSERIISKPVDDENQVCGSC